MAVQNKRLVLYSRYAFYPIHFEAFKYLCANYQVDGTIIGHELPDLPGVHRQLGRVDSQAISAGSGIRDVKVVPTASHLSQASWLVRELRTLKPDCIWVQEEPTDRFLFYILGLYYFGRAPRIVSAVCENIFHPGPRWTRHIKRRLWGRLDCLLATAKPSIEGIRNAGLPETVSTMSLVGGATPAPEEATAFTLPLQKSGTDFVVGFAGRICEEKGWKVLLTAMTLLPSGIKCALAGDGPQSDELRGWAAGPELKDRVCYVGLLPKAELWRFYRALDCLVIPSLTFPKWKEQFGGVLADGMAVGLPLIGSDSGSIPEVIGPAGIVVPENDPTALARAIRKLSESSALRERLGAEGKRRFDEEFAIPAYARKIAAALQLEPRAVSI